MIRTSSVAKCIKNLTVAAVRQSHTQTQPLSSTDKCHHYNEAEGHYRSSPFEPVEVPNLKIHEYVWQNLSKYEKTIAVVSSESSLLHIINIKS